MNTDQSKGSNATASELEVQRIDYAWGEVPVPAEKPVVAGHGDRLYCVLSTAHAREPGETAWAGLGWTYGEESGGLFVEHAGATEDDVIDQVRSSLHDMGERRGRHFGPMSAWASIHAAKPAGSNVAPSRSTSPAIAWSPAWSSGTP